MFRGMSKKKQRCRCKNLNKITVHKSTAYILISDVKMMRGCDEESKKTIKERKEQRIRVDVKKKKKKQKGEKKSRGNVKRGVKGITGVRKEKRRRRREREREWSNLKCRS